MHSRRSYSGHPARRPGSARNGLTISSTYAAKAKEHGTGSLIEGEISPGQRVVVIEDLISTGKSSLQAVHALRDSGYTVAGLAAIFSYGFDVAAENFKEAGCKYFTLSNYNALLKYAEERQYISAADSEILRQWRSQPSTWGK